MDITTHLFIGHVLLILLGTDDGTVFTVVKMHHHLWHTTS